MYPHQQPRAHRHSGVHRTLHCRPLGKTSLQRRYHLVYMCCVYLFTCAVCTCLHVLCVLVYMCCMYLFTCAVCTCLHVLCVLVYMCCVYLFTCAVCTCLHVLCVLVYMCCVYLFTCAVCTCLHYLPQRCAGGGDETGLLGDT